jgi:hypothetical protein
MASAKAAQILRGFSGEQQQRDTALTHGVLKMFESLGTDASTLDNVVDAVVEDVAAILDTPEQITRGESSFAMQRIRATLNSHRGFFPGS